MSIFRRDPEPSPSPPKPPQPTPAKAPSAAARDTPKQRRSAPDTTQIAQGTKVVGEVDGSADLVIEGQVEGAVSLDSRVVVGTKGRVDGTIEANAVQVGGKVHGNIHGRERVEVLASGSLEGDVISPRVVISEGAFFKGKIEMTDPSKSSGAKPETAKPAGGGPSGGPGKGESGSQASKPGDPPSSSSGPGGPRPGDGPESKSDHHSGGGNQGGRDQRGGGKGKP